MKEESDSEQIERKRKKERERFLKKNVILKRNRENDKEINNRVRINVK